MRVSSGLNSHTEDTQAEYNEYYRRLLEYTYERNGWWRGKQKRQALNREKANMRWLWLWLMHVICFGIHTAWMVYTLQASSGDMTVELTRIKPNWENQGGEYDYEVVPLDDDAQIFRIDTITVLFFGLSAGMHSIWVFLGPWDWKWSNWLLWNKLDECLCWWCVRALT